MGAAEHEVVVTRDEETSGWLLGVYGRKGEQVLVQHFRTLQGLLGSLVSYSDKVVIFPLSG